MAHLPKRKRRLPRNIAERPDTEVIERIFGKLTKREMDRIAKELKVVTKKRRFRSFKVMIPPTISCVKCIITVVSGAPPGSVQGR